MRRWLGIPNGWIMFCALISGPVVLLIARWAGPVFSLWWWVAYGVSVLVVAGGVKTNLALRAQHQQHQEPEDDDG